jgi:hypothetical protein
VILFSINFEKIKKFKWLFMYYFILGYIVIFLTYNLKLSNYPKVLYKFLNHYL